VRGEALAEVLSSLRLERFPSVPALSELRNLLTLVAVSLWNVQINTLLVAHSTLLSEVVVGLIRLFFLFFIRFAIINFRKLGGISRCSGPSAGTDILGC